MKNIQMQKSKQNHVTETHVPLRSDMLSGFVFYLLQKKNSKQKFTDNTEPPIHPFPSLPKGNHRLAVEIRLYIAYTFMV